VKAKQSPPYRMSTQFHPYAMLPRSLKRFHFFPFSISITSSSQCQKLWTKYEDQLKNKP
jgi:hypothetical protein